MSWQEVIAKDIVKGRLGGSGGSHKYTNYTNEKLLADAWDDNKADKLIADITAGGHSYTNVIKLLAPFKGKTAKDIGVMLRRDDTYGSIIDNMEDSLNLTANELIPNISRNLARMARVGKGGTTIEAALSQLKDSPSLDNANQLRELIKNRTTIEANMNNIITTAELRTILEDLYPEQPEDKILLNANPTSHPTLQVTWGVVKATTGKPIEGWLERESTTKSHHSYKIVNYTKDSPKAIMQEGKEIVAANEDRGYFSETLPLGLTIMGEKGEKEILSQEPQEEAQEYERDDTVSIGKIPSSFFAALKGMKGSADELVPTIDNTLMLSPIFFSDAKSFKFGRVAKLILFGEGKSVTRLTLSGLDNVLEQVPLIKRGEEDSDFKTRAYHEYSTEYLIDLIYNYKQGDSPIPKTDENDKAIEDIQDQIKEKYGDENIDVEDSIEEINGFDTLEKLNEFMQGTELTREYLEGEDQLEWKTNPLASYEGNRLQLESPSFFEDMDSTPKEIKRNEARRLQSKKELSITFLKTILLDEGSFNFMNSVVKSVDETFESNNKMFNAIIYGLEKNLLDILQVRFTATDVDTLIKTIFTVAIRYDESIEAQIEKLKVEDKQYVPQEGDNEILEAIDIKVRAVWAKINSGFIDAIITKIDEIAELGNDNVKPLIEQGLVQIKGEVEE